MLSESDVLNSAIAMIKRYGANAVREIAIRIKKSLDAGDNNAAIDWHHIGLAVIRIQITPPAKYETRH